MAIDISKNTNHIVTFPSKVASMMGQYGHVINLEMQADSDNGILYAKGDYVSFDRYEADDIAANTVEGVINEAAAEKDCWYVELTKLGSAPVFYSYNTPVSPYPEQELRDERLFYNASGDVTQGAELHLGDVISYSTAAFTGSPVAGKAVKYTAGKWVVQP